MRGSEFAELRAFAGVARHSSFARAARELRIAPSTLSQTVRALEQRLGVTLLVRTTRRVSVTSAGSRLLERFAPAMDEMEAAVLELREGRARPSGVVRLHAPRPAYTSHVEPLLGCLRNRLPDVTLDLAVDDAHTDVASSGYDLAVRRAELVDSGMIALDLGTDLRHAVVASPAYLAAHGAPASPYDLSDHRCVRWRPGGGETQRWRFVVAGDPLAMVTQGPLVVSHCDAAIAAALQDVGIAYVLESYAQPFTADGRLVSLLTEFLPTFGGWKLCRPKQVRPTAAAGAVAEILVGPAPATSPHDPARIGAAGPSSDASCPADDVSSSKAA